MLPLTAKQEKILSFIEQFRNRYSLSPTYQEIGTRFGFGSPNAVQKHIAALIRKGFLLGVRDSNGRTRDLVSVRTRHNKVPLVGRIAAGTPVEAVENIQTRFDFSSLGIDNSNNGYFALTVRGNSMINAHIVDGDMVVIKKQLVTGRNEIAAVLWNGEATLKYVRKTGSIVKLVPANDAMAPIVVDPARTDSFQILGKVVTVIRNCS